MSVVVSLLRAIDRANGEALVMHVGEKPYVVTATGHAELAASALTVPAMTGMLEQLLPADSRQALEELGAVEYHLPSDEASPGTRYSVVAARGGDDIWIEVRRRKQPEEPPVAAPEQAAVPETTQPAEAPPAYHPPPAEHVGAEPPISGEPERIAVESFTIAAFAGGGDVPVVEEPSSIPFEEPQAPFFEHAELERGREAAPQFASSDPAPAPMFDTPPAGDARTYADEPAPAPQPPPESARERAPQLAPDPAPPPAEDEHRYVVRDVADRFELRLQTEDDFYSSAVVEEDFEADVRPFDDLAPAFDFTMEPEPPPAPLGESIPPQRVSLQFHGISSPAAPVSEQPGSPRPTETPAPQVNPLHCLLKVAAAQGASALYVAPQSRPSLRVDGEMRVLEEPPMTAGELEAAFRSLVAVDLGDAALPVGEFETRELHGIGRVQCLLFRDHRGLGAIFRMLPGRTVSAQKAGLSAGIQSLCTEPEGLLLVAGLPSSGKSTLMAALVDQINRTRRDHVITVESDIQFLHENHTSFISQREARDDARFLEAVRAGIREAPDVLVIDGVMNAEVASTALDAASQGLVLVSLTAPSTAAALERFTGFVGTDRPEVRALVSEHLRGVITQALLRKTGGGRAAAREVLVNVPAVAALLANAQLHDLASVLNGGRRIGMVPLNDALLELVQTGALDVRQAYRKSPDPAELVGMLSRAGFDTAFAENLT